MKGKSSNSEFEFGVWRERIRIRVAGESKFNEAEVSETLNLNNSEIKRVAKTKSLGVVVGEGLNCDNQLSKAKGKISGGLRSLRKLKNLIPQSQLDHIYRALVESHPNPRIIRIIKD